MKFFFSILLILFKIISAQDADSEIPELFPDYIKDFNQTTPNLTYYLPLEPSQINKTLALSLLYEIQPQNLSISFSLSLTNFSNNCQSPSLLCLYQLPLQFQQNPQVYIQFLCSSPSCSFKIRPLILSDIPLDYDSPQFIYLYETHTCGLLKLQIPKQQTFEKIVFSVHSHSTDAHNLFPILSLLNFFRVSSGSPSITYLTDRILLIFEANDPLLCSDCQLSFVLCSPDNLILEFLLQSYSHITEISLNNKYIDVLTAPNFTNLYHLTLTPSESFNNSQTKLFFDLTTLTGSKKSMFIQADHQPRTIRDYQYNSSLLDYYYEEDIIISQEDLTLNGFKGQEFFILINSDSLGLYKLELKESTALISALNLGMSDSRAIKAEKINYYSLMIWSSSSVDGDFLLKVTLETGNVELYGRECTSDLECPLITMNNIINKQNLDYKSDTKEGNKVLKISSKCKDNNDNCFLLFAVRGFNSSFLGLNRYTLLITREKDIISLLENTKHNSHIELNGHLRYKLDISDPENLIESIKFRLSADLPYYATRKFQCFEVACVEKIGNARNPLIFTEKPFSGSYFLFVEGLKSAAFSLFPEVIRKSQKLNEIHLTEGKIFKGLLNDQTREIHFIFFMERDDELEIEVILQGSKGKFEIEVLNGEKNGFGWISTNNLLTFRHIKSNNKNYYVNVRAHETNLNSSILEFGLFYATERTLRTLEKNKLFYETLNPQSFKYYLFYIDIDEDSCMITKNIINPIHLASNLELYLGSEPYPEQNFFAFKAEDSETSRIILTPENIKALCLNNTNAHHCPLYLSFHNSDSKEEIIYSLMVHFQNKAIEIVEGQEQRFSLNHKEEVLRGYFLPNSNDSSLDIFFYTENEKFEVFLSIFHDKDHLAVSHHYYMNFPNKTSADFYLHENNQHSLVVKPKSYEFCWPDCVLLFTITYVLQLHESASLSLLISTNNTEIMEGKPMVFALEPKQFKYFYFQLESFLKSEDFIDNSSIILSLTPFYGSARLYLNLAHNLKHEKPTTNKADFYVYHEHFSITKAQILKELEKVLTEKTKLFSSTRLIIGAFAEDSEGKFMLNMIKSHEILQKIYAGTPQELLVKNGTERFFQYYFGMSLSFKVFFNRENGIGTVGLIPCSFDPLAEDSVIFKDCLKKPETGFKIIGGSGSSYLEINKEIVANFCVNCYYLLHLKTFGGDLKGSLVVKDGERTLISLQEGRKFYDHLDKKEENSFIFWSSAREVIEITMMVFQGDPKIFYSSNYAVKKESFLVGLKKNNKNFIQFLVPPRRAYYDKLKPLREWEMPDEWGQYSNGYLLVDANDSPCEYSLSYLASGSHILQGGLIHMDSLKVLDRKSYLYSQMNEFPAFLTISFEKNVNFTKDIFFSASFRPFDEKFGFQASEIIEIQLEKQFESSSSLGFSLPAKKTGTYFLNISSLKRDFTQKPIEFSIVLNAKDISIIPYNVTLRSYFPLKTTRFYEIFVPFEGYFVIDLLQCFGSLELFMTKDYHKLLLEDFDEDFQPVTGHSLIHVMKVQSGMIYFVIKTGLERSILDFTVRLYESYSQIPQVKFALKNQGGLDYGFDTNNDSLKVSFEGLSCENCQKDEIQRVFVEYIVVSGENMQALLAKGKCEVFELEKGETFEGEIKRISLGKMPLNKEKINVWLKLPSNKIHYISIKAIVSDEKGEEFSLEYPIFETIPERKHHPLVFFVILSFIIVTILGCCLLAMFYFKRYRDVMKKLSYEMQDVRNVAQMTAVNTSIEMENKKYQGLADETH